MATIVDSGTLDQYVDDKLVSGIRQLTFDYEEKDVPRIIAGAGLYTLLGTATGKLRSKVTDNDRTRTATLPIMIMLDIGCILFC